MQALNPTPLYRTTRVGGCTSTVITRSEDGSVHLASPEPLAPYLARLTDALEHWAQQAPGRVFVARRDATLPGQPWQTITYAQMRDRARRLGQALLDLGASAQRPLLILSGNDLEHLSLALGAMWAGIPHVPASPAYSLLSQDHGKLRHIVGLTTPGVVFASGSAYLPALQAVLPPGTPVVMTEVLTEGSLAQSAAPEHREPGSAWAGIAPGLHTFERLLHTEPGPALDAAHAAVGPDTVAKVLFTSGSTRLPKGVITTHRMWCANQQMLRQSLAFLADEPPVLVDWLPWNHVFGGSHNVGITLVNGGTLYIDDGKPTSEAIGPTLRNLREISPTVYFNVPKGLEMIAQAMRSDTVLRDSLFRRCQAMMFAGAGLSQAVWDELDRHAEAAIGERLRMITGLGMTEAAPTCTFAVGTDTASGHIGLPVPGVETKLVWDAAAGKTEIRFRGPNVMPGYWRAPEQTAEAFDEEGFYRTGDAVRWIDEADPQRGLRFDGRLAEDFKLATGTFVSVGPLRARIVREGDPCVWDAVITGLNRNEVGALVFPRLEDCRRLAGLRVDASPCAIVQHPAVRAFFQALLDRLQAGATGSASRVVRLHVMAAPPSLDLGEVTDKGSINQRAVLTHRVALVERLHSAVADDGEVLRTSAKP
ncbi:MAG: feruloyl-CoA synthase [Betaproteobacteria bacterium]|jgi:feruloyl-CoA synthase